MALNPKTTLARARACIAIETEALRDTARGLGPEFVATARAVEAARARGCTVVTLSGFGSDNPLRRLGDVNFYLASDQYGFVEIGHQALIHAILDMAMGWSGRISATAGIPAPAGP